MSEVSLDLIMVENKVFEQVVFSEVLVPNVFNTWGDWYPPEVVKEFAYAFAQKGYGIDVEHDSVDVKGIKCFVCESFIARTGDPDFIEGSWVVGIKILDSALWQQVLDGEINGLSFQADIFFDEIPWPEEGYRVVYGVTEPDPYDGHTHTFAVVLNGANQVISGSTGVTDGHSHSITVHTVTGEAAGHTHRYQVVEDKKDAT